ncbi:hypothetical protein [Thioclava sp. GXIMD4215]|uniref:hypothetical protein n=1 Tax=Thioclava sp. GXIMD4215 TaxID=3131928 RepID=UPI003248873E
MTEISQKNKLQAVSAIIWSTCDDLWKIWRWIALSMLAAKAYFVKHPGKFDVLSAWGDPAFVFGVIAALLAISSTASRFVMLSVFHDKEGGKTPPKAAKFLFGVLLVFIGVWIGVYTWALVSQLYSYVLVGC